MSILLSILIGIAVFVLAVWLTSEIQIRVWIKAIEKQLQNKFTKQQKSTVDEEEK